MSKGQVTGTGPIKVDVEAGQDYWWCACGQSSSQPFCDGSHEGSDFTPVKWTADESGERWFCACKQTGDQPFCDGSHAALEAVKPADGAAAQIATVEQRPDGPLVVKHVETFIDADGIAVETKAVMALCRCGHSKNKPFCDGSHQSASFSSAREDAGKKDRVIAYAGESLTVHYNPLACGHAAECVRMNEAVFDPSRRPWIEPDNASSEAVLEIVAACPSGALRVSRGEQSPEHITGDGVSVRIQRHGPYWLSNVDIGEVDWPEGATPKKFILCRCGHSKNKPFCDGSHRDAGWRDDA
jgi:CDGSH-type Zn-finger protein